MEWLYEGIAKLDSMTDGLLNDSFEMYDSHRPNAKHCSAGARLPASEKMRLLYPCWRSTDQFVVA